MPTDNNKGVFDPQEVSKRTREVIEERTQDPDGGLRIGIPDIDKVLLPMRPGEVIGVLGYTSNFKSGFMNSVARFQAKRIAGNGTNEAVVSVLWEQSIEEQGAVDIAQLIHLDATKMMRGELNTTELKRMREGAEARGKIPWYLIGHSVQDTTRRLRMSMTDVSLAFQYITDELDIKPILITLDYLQRIRREKAESMREGFMTIVDRTKDMSLALGAPVMLGCQAKRDVKRRKWCMPQQDDAQETSNFEQTCDKLISLWMPKNDRPQNKVSDRAGLKYKVTDNLLLLLIAKQRFGPAPRLFSCHVEPEKGIIGKIDPFVAETN